MGVYHGIGVLSRSATSERRQTETGGRHPVSQTEYSGGKGWNMHYRKMTLVWGAMIFCLVNATSLFAADVAKIGVVDFQRFFTTSKAGKAIQEQMTQKGREMEKDLRRNEAEVKEIQDRLEREAMVMSKEVREQKERELRIKVYDLKALEKKYRDELKVMEGKLVGKIRDDLLNLIEETGKKEGYLIIIDKAVAIYNPSTIDITDQLIQKSDAQKIGENTP